MIQVEQAGRELRVTGSEYELMIPLDYGPRVRSLRLSDGPRIYSRISKTKRVN